MRSKTLCLVFLAAFCLPASPIRAQEAPERATARLETVVVTAGRLAEKPTNVTQAMTVIPQEEIAKHQYQDMGDLLRNYGIQVDASGSGNEMTTNIAMRGVRTNLFGYDLMGGVLVLVDGRRAGTSNISLMPLINVERIEILRGPAAVQYGSSAIGGVINVITRRGGTTPKLSAEGGYGSWNTARAQGEASWAYGPFDFSGGVSYLSSQDYQSNTFRRYHNTGIGSRVGYSLNAGLNFLEEHRLGVTLHGVEGQRMGSPYYYPHNLPGGPLGIDALDYFHTRNTYTNRYNRSLDVTYDGGYQDAGLSWKARYYYGGLNNYYDSDERGYSNLTMSPVNRMGQSTYQTEYQGAQGQISFTRGFLTLTGGADWQRYDYKSRNYLYDDMGWGGFVQHLDGSSAYDVLGGFLLAKLAFFDDLLIISGGLRHDKYFVKTSSGYNESFAGFPGVVDNKPSRSREFSHTTPSVGVAVNPLSWLTLRANYGESYQVPNHQNLLGFFDGINQYFANSHLKPETGIGWDVGFDVHYQSLNLGVTFFSTDYQNKIATRDATLNGVAGRQYYNMSGTAYYRGIEAQAGYDLGEAFSWPFTLRPYVNLTHLLERRGRDATRNYSYQDAPNVSDTTVAYGVQFKHPDIGLEVDLRATYYGYSRQLRWAEGTNAQFWANPDYQVPYKRVGGETIVDIFATQTLYKWEGAGKLSLKGEIRNLFNAKHEIVADYRMPGRSFWLGLRYDY
ncbi:MAG: TonB-dependent receptor [Deltaproteobacteria bacterium]|jgi:vitamin B12 transporter|nr:TonB-dependent receptor [Deltaproteobacteria bacterium]